MAAARNHEIDCVLVWKFDRFARSTRHLLAALEEFNHLRAPAQTPLRRARPTTAATSGRACGAPLRGAS
jgi:DNA invertase Pin-like site-specific DNA recombinase